MTAWRRERRSAARKNTPTTTSADEDYSLGGLLNVH
jgi:hypothetical protein